MYSYKCCKTYVHFIENNGAITQQQGKTIKVSVTGCRREDLTSSLLGSRISTQIKSCPVGKSLTCFHSIDWLQGCTGWPEKTCQLHLGNASRLQTYNNTARFKTDLFCSDVAWIKVFWPILEAETAQCVLENSQAVADSRIIRLHHLLSLPVVSQGTTPLTLLKETVWHTRRHKGNHVIPN